MSTTNRIVFCFAGQGYTPLEAARDLYRGSEAFRAAIETMDLEIVTYFEEQQDEAFASLGEYLLEDEEERKLKQVCTDDNDEASDGLPTNSNPSNSGEQQGQRPPLPPPPAALLIFSAQYALAKTLETRNIRPTDIIAYSLGEHAASMYTGSLPLRIGIRLLLR